jgi:predicted Fe-Mo cluster-binding NifX family protein
MRIAIPVAQGRLSLHFGHCAEFVVVDVDPETKTIQGTETLPAPPHQPGLLPQWLAERGVNMVIAGGMGMRAQQFFQQYNIQVVIGAPSETPETVVQGYLAGTLETGQNICDH